MFDKLIPSLALVVSAICSASPAPASIPSTTQPAIKEVLVKAGDANLFCRVAGKGNPLIVIHGGPGMSQDYLLPYMYELAKDNLVIFYDQRGCGKSTGEINDETITIPAFVNDIDAIRRSFGFEKVSLLGHSYGAFLAMNYAIAHPEHVNKLIISNSFPSTAKDYVLYCQGFLKQLEPHMDRLQSITSSREYLEGDPKATKEYYLLLFRLCCYDRTKVDLLNLSVSQTAAVNGMKVYKCLKENSMEQPFDLSCDLQKLKMDTLVIHGDVDHVPYITAQHIHENIPGSKYILMKKCGHFPYIEEPETYFRYIREFLRS